MELVKSILDQVGYVSTVITIIGVVTLVIAWFKGLLPSILRLGFSLSNRKIAVLAKGDNLKSLVSLVKDSKIFQSKNIIEVCHSRDFGKLEEASIYLLYWPDFSAEYKGVLAKKKDSDAIVVYAPMDKGRIENDDYNEINRHRNAAVTNFRGRLLNDIFTSMITSGYGK